MHLGIVNPSKVKLTLFPVKWIFHRNFTSKTSPTFKPQTNLNIRNIGIIAHIDAGKTTTTERLLYHSGMINQVGNVDKGTTVTDYLPMERERGITIQSACISCSWLDSKVNLIDTPGHIDFTLEVERSLRVLDGVVVVLDGNRGIQPQTLKVWNQSTRLGICKLVFCNKLDRNQMDLNDMAKLKLELQFKLHINPILLQIPVYNPQGKLVGVVDLIKEELIRFDKKVVRSGWLDSNIKLDWLNRLKLELLESLAELDEPFLNLYLEDQLNPTLIFDTIRKLTITNQVVPILCGSSLKDVGIQTLLDAVVHYLPSPSDTKYPLNLVNNTPVLPKPEGDAVALVFKVLVDPIKGNLTFIRMYSGTLKKGTTIRFIKEDKVVEEKIGQTVQVYSDQLEPIQELSSGDVGILLGLKYPQTGDTLFLNRQQPVQLETIPIPKPVLAISVELESQQFNSTFQEHLRRIQLEDPSCKVHYDLATQQTLIFGMGSLHLEVIRTNLESKMKDQLRFGQLQVAYKELLLKRVEVNFTFQEKVLNTNCNLSFTLKLEPIDAEDNQFQIQLPKDYNLPINSMELKKVLTASLRSCTHRGGPHFYPLIKTQFTLTDFDVQTTSVPGFQASIQAAYTHILTKHKPEFQLVEPIYHFDLLLNQEKSALGKVLNEIKSRNGEVTEVCQVNTGSKVLGYLPLSKSFNWVDTLRNLTKGQVELDSKVEGYTKSI